ncbi:MAG: hypothetical protein WAM42_13500 [Candidatus Nitrosopolaris sp.]
MQIILDDRVWTVAVLITNASAFSFLFMGGILTLSIRSELFLPAAHFFGMVANDFERIFTVVVSLALTNLSLL